MLHVRPQDARQALPWHGRVPLHEVGSSSPFHWPGAEAGVRDLRLPDHAGDGLHEAAPLRRPS